MTRKVAGPSDRATPPELEKQPAANRRETTDHRTHPEGYLSGLHHSAFTIAEWVWIDRLPVKADD